jgi:hypothetical protein
VRRAGINKLEGKAAVGKGRLCGKRVLLAKPLTFMNVSGESVGALVRFYKARPAAPRVAAAGGAAPPQNPVLTSARHADANAPAPPCRRCMSRPCARCHCQR